MRRCHQLLCEFLAKAHLHLASRQSLRSLMIRVIMKLSRGLCLDLLAFALQLRKTPGKPYLGDSLMKGLCDQLSPQLGSLSSKWGRYNLTERQVGRRKERTGKVQYIIHPRIKLIPCLVPFYLRVDNCCQFHFFDSGIHNSLARNFRTKDKIFISNVNVSTELNIIP